MISFITPPEDGIGQKLKAGTSMWKVKLQENVEYLHCPTTPVPIAESVNIMMLSLFTSQRIG